MWHILMYQKHIEFFKKHLKFFMGLETLSIVSCPLGDIPPRDFSIMTLVKHVGLIDNAPRTYL